MTWTTILGATAPTPFSMGMFRKARITNSYEVFGEHLSVSTSLFTWRRLEIMYNVSNVIARGSLYSSNEYYIDIPTVDMLDLAKSNISSSITGLSFASATVEETHSNSNVSATIVGNNIRVYLTNSGEFSETESPSDDDIVSGSISVTGIQFIRSNGTVSDFDYTVKFYIGIDTVIQTGTVTYLTDTSSTQSTFTVNEPLTLGGTSESGYVSGWYTDVDGQGTRVGDYGQTTDFFKCENYAKIYDAFSSSYLVALYGHSVLIEYTVQFKYTDYDDGDTEKTITLTGSVETPITVPSVSFTHYTLTGWSNGSTTYAPSRTFYPSSNDTFTAVTTPIQYTWTLKGYKGNTVAYRGNVETPITLPDAPSVLRSYYNFVAWVDSNGTRYYGGSSHTPTSDKTLTEIWTPIQYTVTFKSYDNTVKTLTGTVETPVTIPSPKSRTDYTFLGWYRANGEPLYAVGDKYYPKSNVTFTEEWQINKYTLTLVYTSSHTVTASYDAGTNVSLSESDIPEREHYTPVGWYEGSTFRVDINGTYKVTKNVTLTLKWVPTDYTVSFISYTGDVVSELVGNIETPITVPTPNVRQYYTFLGWTNGTDSDDVVSPGDTITPTKNLVYNETWNAIYYDITYTTTPNTTYTVSWQAGTKYTLRSATRPFYTAKGWYEGDVKIGDFGDEILITRDMTIHIEWEPIEYTWTFQYYDGTSKVLKGSVETPITIPSGGVRENYIFRYWQDSGGDTYSPNESIYISKNLTLSERWDAIQYAVTFRYYDDTVKTLTGTVETPVTVPSSGSRANYTFSHWTDGTTDVDVGDSIYPSSHITFTQVWTPIQYTVQFKSYDGTVTTKTGSVESSVTAPTPTRTHYTFSKWVSGSTSLNAGASYTPYANITFTQVWVPIQYTVQFKSYDGTVTSLKGSVESSVTAPTPTRDHYTFSKWVSGSTSLNAGASYTPYANITFTQSWVAIVYTIKFISHDGTVTSKTGTVESSVTAPTPTRTHYTFSYWTDGTTRYNAGSLIYPKSSMDLVQVWTPIQYTVQFKSYDGSVISKTGSVESSVTAPTPTRTHYTFSKWVSGSTSINAGASYTPYANIIFTESWVAIVYTARFVSYDDTVKTLTGTVETPITIPSNKTWAYHTFLGWSSGDTLLSVGDTYTLTSDITFTESWNELSYTVTFVHYTGITTSLTKPGGTSISLPVAKTDWTDSEHFTEGGWYNGNTFVGDSGDSYTVTRNITLTMKWVGNTYTIKYTTVGGTAPSSVTYQYYIGYTIQLASAITNYTYHTFKSWKDESTGTTYSAGASFTPKGNVTFSAVFTHNSYTVTFVHYTGITTKVSELGGESITLPTGRTDWTDSEYYSEQGWYSGSTLIGVSGSSYTVTKNITLTMRWVGNTYTVKYTSVGGTVPSSVTYQYSAGYTIQLPSAITNYTHYTFTSWKDVATNTTYSAGATFTPKGNVTFSAVFTIKRYTVTYKSVASSDTYPDSVPASETVNALTSITLGTPTRSHYRCIGWYTNATTGTKVGDVGASYTMTGNITLYPRWELIIYTVSFVVPTGIPSIASKTGSVFDALTLPFITTTLTDKTFRDWNTKSDGTGTRYAQGQLYYPTSDITLYAYYTNNHIIRYYSNRNSSDNTYTTSSVSQGSNTTLSAYPTNTYFYGVGWYSARSGGTLIGVAKATYRPTASIDLYARWERCPSVTFDATGGLVEGSSSITVYTALTTGTTYMVLASDYPSSVTRDYHEFVGWYDQNGNEYTSTSVYSQSVTLYARWTEVKVASIRVSVNDVTGSIALSQSGITSYARATIVRNNSPIMPDLSKLQWSVSSDIITIFPDDVTPNDMTVRRLIPNEIPSGTTVVTLTCSISYDDGTVISGSMEVVLTYIVYLTLLNDHAQNESDRVILVEIDDITHLPTTFPPDPTREGYVFNAWLDTSTNAKVDANTPIMYNKRAKAYWFKSYDQWDKDNMIVQLFNHEGSAIVKQFALGTILSISTSMKINPSSVPTPMQTSESTFLMDMSVTMTIEVECERANPRLGVGESFDDDGEDYNYWTNTKWVNEVMSLVDRWQGETDGVKVLFIPNDCKVYDHDEGTMAYGQFYRLIGTVTDINGNLHTHGFLYKGTYYQGLNAYISNMTRSIDKASPEVTSVKMTFAVGGMTSRYVK